MPSCTVEARTCVGNIRAGSQQNMTSTQMASHLLDIFLAPKMGK